MPLADVTTKLYDRLHALDLALDVNVEVLCLHFREAEEMDGARIVVAERGLGDESS